MYVNLLFSATREGDLSNSVKNGILYLEDPIDQVGDAECTVISRYLELRYLEFCETRTVYLNQKYILIAFSNHNLAFNTFLQVQITRSANKFALRVI